MKVKVMWTGRITNARFRAEGKTVEEVVKFLNSKEEWGRFDWKLEYKIWPNPQGTVRVIVLKPWFKISMPSWRGYTRQSQAIKNAWDSMYRALRKHENEHKTKFITDLQKLQRKLEMMDPCAQSECKNILDEAMKEIQTVQDKFDVETNHGKDRGVVINI